MNRRQQQADTPAEEGLDGVIGLGPIRIAALRAAGIVTRADLARIPADRLVGEFGMQPAYAARALEMVRVAIAPTRRGRPPATLPTATGETAPLRRGRKPAGTVNSPDASTPPKRRGRPPKSAQAAEVIPTPPPRRGRPPKSASAPEATPTAPVRRGRPPKSPAFEVTAAPEPEIEVLPAEQEAIVEASATPGVEPETPEVPEAEPSALGDLDHAESSLRTAIATLTQRYAALERPLLRVTLLLDKLRGCVANLPRRKLRRLASRLQDLAERLEKATARAGDLTPKREERLRERIREDRRSLADAIADAETRGKSE